MSTQSSGSPKFERSEQQRKRIQRPRLLPGSSAPLSTGRAHRTASSVREYYGESGRFYYNHWDISDGPVYRSLRLDHRSREGELAIAFSCPFGYNSCTCLSFQVVFRGTISCFKFHKRSSLSTRLRSTSDKRWLALRGYCSLLFSLPLIASFVRR